MKIIRQLSAQAPAKLMSGGLIGMQQPAARSFPGGSGAERWRLSAMFRKQPSAQLRPHHLRPHKQHLNSCH